MDFLFEFCRHELKEGDYVKVKDVYRKGYIFEGSVSDLLTNLNLTGFCVIQYEMHADYIELFVV